MWCPKISSSRSLRKGPVLYPAKNEEIYGIVPYQNFSCHVTLATFKRKLQHVGHKWVICGSHLDCSVGEWVKWVNKCDPFSTLSQTEEKAAIIDLERRLKKEMDACSRIDAELREH